MQQECRGLSEADAPEVNPLLQEAAAALRERPVSEWGVVAELAAWVGGWVGWLGWMVVGGWLSGGPVCVFGFTKWAAGARLFEEGAVLVLNAAPFLTILPVALPHYTARHPCRL